MLSANYFNDIASVPLLYKNHWVLLSIGYCYQSVNVIKNGFFFRVTRMRTGSIHPLTPHRSAVSAWTRFQQHLFRRQYQKARSVYCCKILLYVVRTLQFFATLSWKFVEFDKLGQTPEPTSFANDGRRTGVLSQWRSVQV